ncbi:hypothetical protein Dacet_1493 [Denitrovibrio acetiphilus DSM 12809]|jgi:hypothetical protein|uniref:Uncharacterized protein n=1 Tax=Denitrovibrio acetiphilus (strain DSM 12809 / NBRC 114555 / N2460) TaxID=522772 RepID=D4H8B3_DENA2|nr:hypothetical protein [Denitrovibrio acetiphilus]ADD68262.1 hypothetical protein Dacet_1493 [Denitrovibrio acetiphilus DSM 12809]
MEQKLDHVQNKLDMLILEKFYVSIYTYVSIQLAKNPKITFDDIEFELSKIIRPRLDGFKDCGVSIKLLEEEVHKLIHRIYLLKTTNNKADYIN